MMEYTKEIQELFIGIMLDDPDSFVRCQSILKPSYFEKDLSKVISYILKYSEKYSALPTREMIVAEKQVKIPKLDNIKESDKKWFLDSVESFCRHKAVEHAVIRGVDLIDKKDYTTLEKMVRDAIIISLHKDLGTDYFKDPRERLLKLQNQNGNLSSGWKEFDKTVYKLGRGELLIFSAVTGGGKSVGLANLSVNFAQQGFNVIYFTFELSEELVAKRIDAMITNTPSLNIYKDLDKVEKDLKNKENIYGKIQIKYLPSGTSTNEIKAYLKEYQIQTGIKPDMIAVDYLDLMSPNNKRLAGDNLFIKDKYVSEELRSLAKEQSLLLATASQLNRGGYDELAPSSANIAGGISKAHTCDVMVNIRLTPQHRERGEVDFQFMKTRNSGGVGSTVTLQFNPDTLKISDKLEEGETNTSPTKYGTTIDKLYRKSEQEKSDTDDQPVFDNTPSGKGMSVKDRLAILKEKAKDRI